jgi:hypothetical protein
VLHHRNRVSHRTERRTCDRFFSGKSCLHPGNVRKENHLFFHHVRAQFLSEAMEYLANLQEFGMVPAVNGTDLLQQWPEAGNLFLCVFVMGALNVRNQSCQRLRLPVSLLMPGAIKFIGFGK